MLQLWFVWFLCVSCSCSSIVPIVTAADQTCAEGADSPDQEGKLRLEELEQRLASVESALQFLQGSGHDTSGSQRLSAAINSVKQDKGRAQLPKRLNTMSGSACYSLCQCSRMPATSPGVAVTQHTGKVNLWKFP